ARYKVLGRKGCRLAKQPCVIDGCVCLLPGVRKAEIDVNPAPIILSKIGGPLCLWAGDWRSWFGMFDDICGSHTCQSLSIGLAGQDSNARDEDQSAGFNCWRYRCLGHDSRFPRQRRNAEERHRRSVAVSLLEVPSPN